MPIGAAPVGYCPLQAGVGRSRPPPYGLPWVAGSSWGLAMAGRSRPPSTVWSWVAGSSWGLAMVGRPSSSLPSL
ncbi:hypothetical protein B296_00026291 [Ensete ventricosum]|uniref:Uncharacterized protein n=1 Tax=Ensete ventricosum TaxID=4639 RepID=A0A426YNL9_ENSVE|nr:hypothetical protein B296_00026291 [Ensete ventricosum]